MAKVYISLASTDVLYHITSIGLAVKILETNSFHLKPSDGTEAEEQLTNKGAYYLSTTRSKVGSYTRQSVWSYSVIFVLDGRKLANRYKIKPVDYWGTLKDGKPYDTEDAYHLRRDRNESEDRILSPTPIIPAWDYIKEIHAHVNGKSDLMFKIKKAALIHKVGLWFYNDAKNLMLLNKAKAVDVDFIKIDTGIKEQRKPGAYEYSYQRKNSIKPWLTLWHVVIPSNKTPSQIVSELNDREVRLKHQVLQYSDALRILNADLHNAKGVMPGHLSKEREMLDSLILVMRKNKLTPAQFIDKLKEKYYPSPTLK